MDPAQLAVQLWTVRETLKTPKEIGATLEKIRKIGYAGVELAGLGPIGTAELRALLDDTELACISAHKPYDRVVKETDDLAGEMTALGAKFVACASLPKAMHSEAGFREGAKGLNKAGAKLAAKGITLAYHNHGFEFERFGDKLGIEILYGESDPANLKAQLDTFWVQNGGASPAAWVKRLSGRLPMLHLKDAGVIGGRMAQYEIGEGNLDWGAILPAAREGGTEWFIVELGNAPHEPIESLRISFENLKNM